MSIAADEAERYFPTQYWPHMEPNGDYLGKECYIEGVKSSDIQEAYEQGRTAEPTEAEIEAAATEWDRHGYCCRVGTPIVCLCGGRAHGRAWVWRTPCPCDTRSRAQGGSGMSKRSEARYDGALAMLIHGATRKNGLRSLNDIITDLVAIARRVRAQAGVYEQQEDRRASLLRDAADQLDVIISRLEGRL